MKLIRQTRVWRQTGDVTHIYEIDLCEVSTNKYAVNFRHGSKGGRMQEGTKTVFPVYHSVAEKIFTDLLDSKLQEGYHDQAAQPAGKVIPIRPEQSGLSQANLARKTAILHHLQQASLGEEVQGKWKLSRIIWRAGEMKLAEAVPSLIQLAGEGDEMQQYSLLWALGRCATPESARDVLQVLSHYYGNDAQPEKLRRIAAAGISLLQTQETSTQFSQSLLDALPSGLREAVLQSDAEVLSEKLHEYVFELKTTSNEYITTLYLLSRQYPHIKPALCRLLSTIPFQPNYVHQIRYILKASEFSEDAEIYGLLAYRLEHAVEYYTPYRRSYWRNRQWHRTLSGYVTGVGYVDNIDKEFGKAHPKVAFSTSTKAYLQRRTIQTLKRSGELENSAYTDMASAILLQFNDDVDRAEPYKITSFRYAYRPYRRIEHHVHYDAYAASPLLNFILYANSPRYQLRAAAKAWNCIAPYEPGQPAPDVREEAFPDLWTAAPQSLLKLLLNSRCQGVHEFAAKAFRAVPNYAGLVNVEQMIVMLNFPYLATNELAFELAKQHYSPHKPDRVLVKALLSCRYKPARDTARAWIEDNPALFLQDAMFVCDVLFHPQADVRTWLKSLLPTYPFSELEEHAIISKAISTLLALLGDSTQDALIRDVGEILLLTFPRRIYTLGLDVIRDLLRHPHCEMQALAGKILLKHATGTKDLPEDLFMALLQATAPQIRALGVQLLGQLPDAILLTKERVLTSFCIAEITEIRNAVQPIIARLAQSHKAFGDSLVQQLYTVLLFKESYEGIHETLYDLFTTALTGSLDIIDSRAAWKMLNSKHLQANRLGCYLLQTTLDITTFTMRQIVTFSKSELHELRQTVWNGYRQHPERIKQDKEEALRIVDTDWDDTREFAFDYFRSTFTEDDWTPELLVSLCDSVREDVRAFGRSMITRFFQEAHGADYLLKLSQHPSADLQLFATNYLEGFATGNIEHIRKLEPYFITILSQVNTARVAKARVFQFLRTEALKDQDAAAVTARILTRQSATMAIGDKAACIGILRDIHRTYPELETPLMTKDAPVYRKNLHRPMQDV